MNNALWLDNLLHVVEELSSTEFQERVWIKGEEFYFSSYVEADCNFFDGNADQFIDIEWRKAGLTLKQRDKLARFRDALNQFDASIPENPTDAEVLQHRDWVKIRNLAVETLTEFVPPNGNYKPRYVGEWWKEPPKLFEG